MSQGTRIGIIGAGAAGLSAAHYLKKQGYQDITLFEADDRVGGKCCSIQLDGAVFDIGAVIATMGYNRVLDLAAEYQVPLTCAPRLYFRSIASSDKRKLGSIPFDGLNTVTAMLRFAGLLRQARAARQPGHRQLQLGLHQSIDDWMREKRVQEIQNAVVPAFTGFGYGYKEHTPIAYALKAGELSFADTPATGWRWYNNVRQCLRKEVFRDRNSRLLDLIEPLMFERGYQSLFEAIAGQFNVKLNTAITAIQVKGDVKTLLDNQGQSHTFDRIIVATPPAVTARLMNFNRDLSAVFELPETLRYHVFLTEFKQHMNQEAWFLPENTLDQTRLGRPVVISRVTPNSTIGTCYAYSDNNITESDLEQNLEQDCDRLGVGLKSIRVQRRWDYFPHLNSQNFKPFYEQMEQAQGKRGIYFAGEVANFGTVEHVVCYSRSLVERYF